MDELLGLLILFAVALAILIIGLTVIIAHRARRPPRVTGGTAVARGWPIDPGDMGLEYRQWELNRPGGVRLPVWEIGSTDGTSLPTTVMVHGWAQSRIDLLPRLDPWLEVSGGLVLYDQRGHGEASGLSGLGRHEIEDLLALLDRLDRGPVFLAGYSFGARVALGVAARQNGAAGGMVAGVVAYGPYCKLAPAMDRRVRSLGVPARPMTSLARAWFRARGLHHHPADRDAESIGCPLMVIHGGQDTICPIEDARRIVDAAADAELVTFPDAAHLDTHEVDKERHDAEVRKFVERATKPGRMSSGGEKAATE